MVTRDMTIRGKEILLLYRKAPLGEGRLVKAMLLRNWLIIVPLTGVLAALLTGFIAELSLVAYATGLILISAAGVVVFVLGIFLLNPAFSEKSMSFKINIFATLIPYVGIFIISLIFSLTTGILFENAEVLHLMFYLVAIQSAMGWLVGIILLLMGKERLKRVE